jgi:methionyl aminopeptidase
VSAISIKTDKEIDKMREACRTASVILDKISAVVRPGVTTKEVDEAAADFMSDAKCTSAFLGYRVGNQVFPGHICISINEEVVHGIGGSRRVKYGDIVKIDCGIVKDGWIGDTATTVAAGVVDPRVQRLLHVTEDALELGIKKACAGRRVGDIGAAIEDEVIANGFSVVREFVGHGVGRKLHEEPQIPNYGRPGTLQKLKPGMTLAIEPMVNMGAPTIRILDDRWTVVTTDGQPSAHFEHTVLITSGEPEILTMREKTASKK